MFLTRLGNKREIAQRIIPLFPKHSVYIDMFFGAGGIFFKKPLCRYNWCNDINGDVFNLFDVVMKKREALEQAVYNMPLCEDLFNAWKTEKETDPVLKALRFLMLSNFSLMGKRDTMRLLHSNIHHKAKIIKLLDPTQKYLQRCMFRNKDFREFMTGIMTGEAHIPNSKRFIYADPPYLGRTNTYDCSWKESDTIDLVELLSGSGIRFAMSEFDSQLVRDLATDHKLKIIDIGERRNIESRENELLIINYAIPKFIQREMFAGA